MSSNLYLFDPKKVQSNAAEKPLIEVMHEAQIARAEESARIVKSFATRVAGLFGRRKPAAPAKPAAQPANAAVDQRRLAA